MITFIIGFILPLIVWILTLPLKIAVRLIDKTLRHTYERALDTYKTTSEKDKNLPNPDKIDKTERFSWIVAKTGYKLTKFSLISSVKTLKLLIKIINILIHASVWIAGLLSVSYTLLIAGAVVTVGVVIASVMALDVTDSTKQNKPIQSPSGGTIIGADEFMAIDWSQDFSAQLDAIESKDGLEARNWVELTIVSMNTMQKAKKDGAIEYAVSGFMTGIKGVESSQVSGATSPNITKQEVKIGGSGGPMQFDTSWQKYNPYYTDITRAQEGSKYYYPDAFYGIALRFNSSSINGYRPERTDALYDKAFQTMGVEKTTDKLRFARYVGNITNEYNAVFLENTGYVPGLTAESANDTVVGNAMIAIQFGELYGYSVNNKTIELVKSLYKNNRDDNYANWFYSKDVGQRALYGLHGGSKNYPNDVDSTTNYGVITPNGEPVNGSLFSYLLSQMPEQARNDMLNNQGFKVYNASRAHYWRARYDLTAFLTGAYDAWWAANSLGVLADSTSKGNIGDTTKPKEDNTVQTLRVDKAVKELALRYANDTSPNRVKFGYAGIGTDHDSASFVIGVLRELGYSPDGTRVNKRPLKDGNFIDLRTNLQIADLAVRNPSVLVSVDSVKLGDIISYDKLRTTLKEGDVLVSTVDGGHSAIYVGRNSQGAHVTVESVTSNPELFNSKSNIELTEGSYGFGYNNLEETEFANKYNYIIRLSNVSN